MSIFNGIEDFNGLKMSELYDLVAETRSGISKIKLGNASALNVSLIWMYHSLQLVSTSLIHFEMLRREMENDIKDRQ